MKKDFSFIEKIGIKCSLVILLILLGPDIFEIFKLIFFGTSQVLQCKNMWFDFSIGIFLIFIMTIPLKYFEERIAVINFGISLVINSFRNFIGYPLSLMLIVLFEFIGVYFFWLAYKTHKQKIKVCVGIDKKKIFIVLFLFLLLPLLIWLIAMIQNRVQYSLIIR